MGEREVRDVTVIIKFGSYVRMTRRLTVGLSNEGTQEQ